MRVISLHSFCTALLEYMEDIGWVYLCRQAEKFYGSGGAIVIQTLLREVYPNTTRNGYSAIKSIEWYLYMDQGYDHMGTQLGIRQDFLNHFLKQPDRMIAIPDTSKNVDPYCEYEPHSAHVMHKDYWRHVLWEAELQEAQYRPARGL